MMGGRGNMTSLLGGWWLGGGAKGGLLKDRHSRRDEEDFIGCGWMSYVGELKREIDA